MDRYTMIVSVSGMICGTIFMMSLIRAVAGRRKAAALPNDIVQRLEHRFSEIQQSLDAVAVEVERISEGQRFTTKLLTERGIAGAELNAVRDAARGTPVR